MVKTSQGSSLPARGLCYAPRDADRNFAMAGYLDHPLSRFDEILVLSAADADPPLGFEASDDPASVGFGLGNLRASPRTQKIAHDVPECQVPLRRSSPFSAWLTIVNGPLNRGR
jgi:hypothetical protein